MAPSGPHGHEPGFSLVELLTTITILGILAVLALPALGGMLQDARRTTATNALLASLMFARSEATRSGQPVSVCATVAGGNACGGTDWSHGWMVFVDAPAPADGVLADASHRLRRHVNDAPGLRLTAATGGPGHFTFLPFNQRGTDGHVTLCDRRGAAHARRICIAGNGRARVSETACSGGAALTCP